jgi:hypothetical protein
MYLMLPEFQVTKDKPSLSFVRNWMDEPTLLLFAEKLVGDTSVFEQEKSYAEDKLAAYGNLSSELIVEMKNKGLIKLENQRKVIESKKEQVWSDILLDYYFAKHQNKVRKLNVPFRNPIGSSFDITLNKGEFYNSLNPACLFKIYEYHKHEMPFTDSSWRRTYYKWRVLTRSRKMEEKTRFDKMKMAFDEILSLKVPIVELRPKSDYWLRSKYQTLEKRQKFLYERTWSNFNKIMGRHGWRNDRLFRNAREEITSFIINEIQGKVHCPEEIEPQLIKRKFYPEVLSPIAGSWKKEMGQIFKKIRYVNLFLIVSSTIASFFVEPLMSLVGGTTAEFLWELKIEESLREYLVQKKQNRLVKEGNSYASYFWLEKGSQIFG